MNPAPENSTVLLKPITACVIRVPKGKDIEKEERKNV